MTRGTPRQITFFYITLRALVAGRIPPPDHILRRCPLDPFEHGHTRDEHRAVRSLQHAAGNWSHALRQLWYGYIMSGQRIEHLHAGISVLTIYDDELRQLLRSHPDDEQLFPRVHFWNEIGEQSFLQKIRELDRQAS